MLLILRLQRRCRLTIHLPASRTLSDSCATTNENDSSTGIWAPTSQWKPKRRLKDQDFIDYKIITVAGGQGGNGCVAFHRPSSPRAPRNPHRLGPPSGGDGGSGGNVYILPDPSLTSLASVPKRVKARPGTHGSGDWQNGKKGEDKIVNVPFGTVVRVVGWGYRPPLAEGTYEWGAVVKNDENVELDRERDREMRWLHYPGWKEANMGRGEFKKAERWLEGDLRRKMREGTNKWSEWIHGGRTIDLDAELLEEEEVDIVNEPLGKKKRKEPMGYLLASGGAGGFGNPHFCMNPNTSSSASGPPTTTFARFPKFAMRGAQGDLVTLSLELKTCADVALLGRCNVGKSTLIRALTGGRVKSDVGDWEGVTRGVVRGVVRLARGEGEGVGEQGSSVWEGELGGADVFDESMKEGDVKRRKNIVADVELSPVPTQAGHGFDLYESFRFTITDNPGFVLPSNEKHEELPITQTILRSIERAKVLVYVVDLSCDEPWDELRDVMKEVVGRHGDGGSHHKTRSAMVIANKADLLVGEEVQDEVVAEAQAKLGRLEEYVRREMGDEARVVPVSAKWGMNLKKVIKSLEVLLKRHQSPS